MISNSVFIPALLAFVVVFILSIIAVVINKKPPVYAHVLALFTNTAGLSIGLFFMYQYSFVSPQQAINNFHSLVLISVFGAVLYSAIKFFENLPKIFDYGDSTIADTPMPPAVHMAIKPRL